MKRIVLGLATLAGAAAVTALKLRRHRELSLSDRLDQHHSDVANQVW